MVYLNSYTLWRIFEMKICIASVSPKVSTGYGMGTKTLIEFLIDEGYEVCVYSVYGNQDFIDVYEYKGQKVNLYPIQPTYGDNMAGVDFVYLKEDFDCLFTFFDIFAFRTKPKEYPVIGWLMLDAEPLIPSNYAALISYDYIIPVTEYAKNELCKLKDKDHLGNPILHKGLSIKYIPLLISPDYYIEDYDNARNAISNYFQVDIKGRLFTTVAANLEDGGTERKNYPELLKWWKYWTIEHPEDYLYLHTDITGLKSTLGTHGMDIPRFLKNIDCSTERILFANRILYNNSEYDINFMRMVFNATDYMLVPSHSEGFGLPYAESAACGSHPIGNNFGSGGEVVKNCQGTLINAEPSYFIYGSYKSKSYASDIKDAVNLAIQKDQKYIKSGLNPRLIRTFATNAHYSLAANKKSITDLFQSVLGHFKYTARSSPTQIRDVLFSWKQRSPFDEYK